MKRKNHYLGAECVLYEKGKDFVRCLNCFHKCVIRTLTEEEKLNPSTDFRATFGICQIRHNYNGKLYLLDHSRPDVVCVDHIEKTPFFHIHPAAMVYNMGTIGCNMRCSFCQNWKVSQKPKIILKRNRRAYLDDLEEILTHEIRSPKEVISEMKKKKCKIIQASFWNEPTIFMDNYLLEIFKLAKSSGFVTLLCTNGYQSIESIKSMHPYVDAVSIGLKSIKNKFYSKHCGARVKPILRNLKIFHQLGVFIEVQSLLIPGENDSDEDIKGLVDFIYSVDKNIPLHWTNYEKEYKFLRDEKKPFQTPRNILEKAVRIAKRKLKFVYCDGMEDRFLYTECPNSKCKEVLVTRGNHWKNFAGVVKGISEKSECNKCGEPIYGWWKDEVKKYSFERCDKTVLKPTNVFTENQPRDILILFGSQTGVSEEFSFDLEKSIKSEFSLELKCQVVDMEDFDETSLSLNKKTILGEERNELVIIVTSTYFYGYPPRNAHRFYSFLMDCEKTLDCKYLVVGIGSTGDRPIHKVTYQVVARTIDKRMKELGATRISQLIELNKNDNFVKKMKKCKSSVLQIIKENICSDTE